MVHGKGGKDRISPISGSAAKVLVDYIENARPKSKNPYIFLSCKTPHNHITTGVIKSSVVKKYMAIANKYLNIVIN